jgi:hypothetical protein
MPEQSNDYRVVVFGAGGVGKSSLVLRFVKGTFRESYIPTVEDTYRQVKKTITNQNYSAIFLDYFNSNLPLSSLIETWGVLPNFGWLLPTIHVYVMRFLADSISMHIGLVLINDVSS